MRHTRDTVGLQQVWRRSRGEPRIDLVWRPVGNINTLLHTSMFSWCCFTFTTIQLNTFINLLSVTTMIKHHRRSPQFIHSHTTKTPLWVSVFQQKCQNNAADIPKIISVNCIKWHEVVGFIYICTVGKMNAKLYCNSLSTRAAWHQLRTSSWRCN